MRSNQRLFFVAEIAFVNSGRGRLAGVHRRSLMDFSKFFYNTLDIPTP